MDGVPILRARAQFNAFQMYKLFLAIRYLRSRKINLVSIAGVFLGVMAMIVILSVMRGFSTELRERIRGTLSHVIIRADYGIEDYKNIIQKALKQPHVVAAAPYVESLALVQVQGVSTWAVIRGIEPDAEARVGKFKDYSVGNSFEVFRAKIRAKALARETPAFGPGGDPGEGSVAEGEIEKYLRKQRARYVVPALVGNALLSYLPEGIDIQLVAPTSLLDFEPMMVEMVGRFKSGNYDHDSRTIYIPLEDAQDLTGGPDTVSGISVRLDDFGLAGQAVEDIRRALGPGFIVETWEAQRKILLAAIDNERRVMAVVLLFITIVAGFCIMATLWMMVVEKTRDIGILKSVGGTVPGVMSIFLLNGTLIGLIGAVLGVLGGLRFLKMMNPLADWIYHRFGWHVFPPNLYYLDHIPYSEDISSMLVIAGSAVLISFLAALYPALKAARLDPVEALRYE